MQGVRGSKQGAGLTRGASSLQSPLWLTAGFLGWTPRGPGVCGGLSGGGGLPLAELHVIIPV